MTVQAHPDSSHEEHHPRLQHHFETMEQQHEASQLGMWLFLVTEILFFGALFLAYAFYRWLYYDAFIAASHHQNILLGGINTAVLIFSSLTVAMSVYYSQTNRRKGLIVMLILTMVLGLAFLGIKAVEYHEHFEHHLFPGPNFQLPDAPGLAAQAQMFYVLYFFMTGLHAFHMIIGLGIYTWLLIRAMKGEFSSVYYAPIEIGGLYWHFVDIVWIFLFPMLYLIGRHY
ncbi:MAG TPA: cytochrome c oxidase subunit 3 family protein [Thermoanaerobaculia bacterium]|nr:cytochrome c oxidase subunit 3 family protein [Thermoanaerobaculia bacterium]